MRGRDTVGEKVDDRVNVDLITLKRWSISVIKVIYFNLKQGQREQE